MRALPAVLAAVAALTLAGTGVALADTTTAPLPTVSVAQVCAATTIQPVDDALKQVAALLKQSDLAAPLLSLDIPAVTSPTANASVQTAAIREKLNCAKLEASATATPEPTVAPKPFRTCDELDADGVVTPVLANEKDYDPRNDSDKDGVACEANDYPGSDGPVHKLPTGGVETGWVA